MASSVHEGAMMIMAGSSMITSGIAKFTAGGSGACLLVGIPGDEIITIPLTVVGTAEATAGLAVAGVGAGIALSIEGNAASSAWDDCDKLKELAKILEEADSKILRQNLIDAGNGVFLPTDEGVANSAYHPKLHTNAYYDKVNKMIREATSKEDVLNILDKIANQLLDGIFI